MKRKIILALVVISGIFGTTMFSNSGEKDYYNVGINQVILHPALDITFKGIKDEIKEQESSLKKPVNLIFESAQGNLLTAVQISKNFSTRKVDAIVALGTTSAQASKTATKDNNIPVVFTSITDPVGAGLLENLKKPEKNITGFSNRVSSSDQLKVFKQILPNLKKIGIIYNPGEKNSEILTKSMKEACKNAKITVEVSPATKVTELSTSTYYLISKGVEAIFIDNDNTALAGLSSIIKIATENKIPVLCTDNDTSALGVLVTAGCNQYELGRETGKYVIEILKGKNISSLPIGFPTKIESSINKEAADKIDFNLPSTRLTDATATPLVSKNKRLEEES